MEKLINKIKNGEVTAENISFTDGMRLLKYFSESDTDPVSLETYNHINALSILLRHGIDDLHSTAHRPA